MKKNTKIMILAGVALIVLVGAIGITFAYLSTGGSQEQANTFNSGCLSISLTNESASINLTSAYPISDIEGLGTTSYDFTITNNCNSSTNYQINLESLNQVSNTLGADYIKVSLSSDTVGNVISKLSDNTEVTPTLDGAYASHNLYITSIGANESKTYHLKLWIDYDATIDVAANKIYTSKINVIANPETQVIDSMEATFTTSGSTMTANLTDNVTSATYCTSTDNMCTPNTSASISSNSYNVTLSGATTKQVATVLGNIDVNTSTPQIVCTRLNGTSKVICSNPNEIDVTPDFAFTSEQADNGIGACYYNGEQVYNYEEYDYSYVTEETCQKVYRAGYVEEGNVYYEYFDSTAENYWTYEGEGGWNGSTCTFEGNPVYDWYDNDITEESNCGAVYYDSNYEIYYTMIEEVGSGTYSEIPGKTGIYEGEDDDGTTYYWRGNVDNNWVSFAGFYWRIVRINGNGSIRLIYSGNSTSGPVTIGEDTQIGTSAFNSSNDDNAYVGFMYGSIGASSYAETHANVNNSTILNTLNTWYLNNIQNAGYSSYIDVDSGFCNDRTLYNGTGIGTTYTVYASVERIWTTYQPTFKCQSSNDLFTTSNSSNGNRALTYPIGLITADEEVYGGFSVNGGTTSNYLYTGEVYWTMSPYGFNTGYVSVLSVWSPGTLYNVGVTGTFGVRPVINISPNVRITGSGTIQDPYVVQT